MTMSVIYMLHFRVAYFFFSVCGPASISVEYALVIFLPLMFECGLYVSRKPLSDHYRVKDE